MIPIDRREFVCFLRIEIAFGNDDDRLDRKRFRNGDQLIQCKKITLGIFCGNDAEHGVKIRKRRTNEKILTVRDLLNNRVVLFVKEYGNGISYGGSAFLVAERAFGTAFDSTVCRGDLIEAAKPLHNTPFYRFHKNPSLRWWFYYNKKTAFLQVFF